jgi:hypothetical protein
VPDRPQKITFAEMRDIGVRGLLVYCADYRCSHSIAISGDGWPNDVRLSDMEARFVCQACGHRGYRCAAGFKLEQAACRGDGLSLGIRKFDCKARLTLPMARPPGIRLSDFSRLKLTWIKIASRQADHPSDASCYEVSR